MDNKLFQIQRQIKENSMSISDYLKDLHDWEKDINAKDKILKSQAKGMIQTTNIRKEKGENITSHISISEKADKPITQNATTKNLKRDVNSIKEYYDAWNRINIEEDDIKDEKEGNFVSNNSEDSSKRDSFINPKKISNAKVNTNIVLKNMRQIVNETKSEDYIDKLKTEANANFAIGNYNKSIELNTAALKQIDQDKININTDKTLKLKIAIYNNRGNSHLKLNNYKEGIKDFNFVLENDKNNLKALFRRGFCNFKMRNFIKAIEDLQIALDLSPESEKIAISQLINDSLNEVNGKIKLEKKKMEKFEYSDEVNYIKIKAPELNKEDLNEEDESDLKSYLENKNKERFKYEFNQVKDQNTNTNMDLNDKNYNDINKKAKLNYSNPNSINTQNILSDEEIKKFVYDLTKENLTSSSFKFAFRNFEDNLQEKVEFLLKINPNYFPKIFMNDMDKNILIEILNCLKSILKKSNENQDNSNNTDEILVVEYLKNLTKTNRFKLILKLTSKKEKQLIHEIFEMIKNVSESVLLPLKDSFIN